MAATTGPILALTASDLMIGTVSRLDVLAALARRRADGAGG
jgi:hypothetical protein